MKHTIRRCAACILALALAMSLAAPAFAQNDAPRVEVVFKGQAKGFDFGSGSAYTATDLFGGMKNILPGDTRTETICLRNEAKDCDTVRLYLRAQVHDETGNPPRYTLLGEQTSDAEKTAQNSRKEETVATMQQFLSQLTLRVYNGKTLIFESTPEQAGALAQNVLLGTLACGESCELRVELDVPAGLDNRFADRVGEVDWIFLAEGITAGGVRYETLIQTGQQNWPVPVLGAAGLLLILCGAALLRRRGERHA